MKTFTFLVLGCCMSVTLWAQPVITADNLPDVAESFSLMPFDATSFDPGDGGADVIWDFSDIVEMGALETTVAHDASTIAGSDLFPEANVAWTLDGLAFTFFKSTGSVFENWGSVINDADLGFITAPYSDGEVLMNLPVNYGDENADDFEGAFSVTGFDVVRSGSNTMVADGYGTLILPDGTVPNVLRVKIIEDYSDEITLLGLSTVYHFEQYFYFKPGFVGPVFQYVYALVDAVGTISEEHVGYFNADAIVAVEDINALSVSVYPNPATENVVVSIPELSGEVMVTLTDITGKLVWQKPFTSAGSIEVLRGQLIAGQYLLTVSNGKQSRSTWISWQ